MEKPVRDKLLVATAIVLAIAAILFVKFILLATTGPVPPGILPGWYLSPGEGEREDIFGQLGKAQYDLLEEQSTETPSGFPILSQYHAFGRYERRNSTDTYRIVSWYFENRNDFALAEKRLLEHLGSKGEIHSASLNMTRQFMDFQEITKVNEIVYCPDIPQVLQATASENPNQSGYFFAVKKPLNWDREDYFLIGYIAETGNLTTQGSYIQDLVARGYYNVTGSYGELEYGM